MSEFGANFRNVRESRSLSLDDIAAETRINVRFLRAIEEEDFEALPGGIVGRGFVRTYATSIGLDPDQFVSEYEKRSTYKEAPLAEGFRTSSVQPTKTNRNFYPIAAGTLALLIVIFYLVTRQSPAAATANQTAAAPTATTQPAPPQPAPPPAPSSSPDTPASQPPVAASTSSTAAKNKALNLEIEAHEDTWIQISADGNSLVVGDILHPGDSRRYSADATMTFVIGNAGGVALKVNGKAVPPLGKTGQVRTRTITPETLKDITP